jgi:DNA polymerase-3 subunit chi
MPRVAFYLLSSTDDRSRLKVACRLTEQSYLSGQRVFVCVEDTAQLQGFDELLWTFADRSFVPHETFREDAQWQETPVLLGTGSQPQQPFEMLINLSATIPPSARFADQIAEIIDADEPRRQAGRIRFRHYRDQGIRAETHNIQTDRLP